MDSHEHNDEHQLMLQYYTSYYRDQLGLPDWESHVRARLEETNNYAGRFIDLIERLINYSFANKEVLVVGAGTGAETFALLNRSAKVIPLEPDPHALHILRKKLRSSSYGDYIIPIESPGETLPLMDNSVDFAFCYTVLEHTKDPERCILEMIRVVRPYGWIFIETPDYRHLYEPHYKMTLPTCLPKWLQKLWLQAKRRPPYFLDSLQFVTTRQLQNLFQTQSVTALQIIHPWPQSWSTHPTFQTRITQWITRTFGFQRDQFWLLLKMPTRR